MDSGSCSLKQIDPVFFVRQKPRGCILSMR